MSTILESVGNYLAANGHGTLGTNLFLSRMPESPDVCVTVYENEGGIPDFTMGSSGAFMDEPAIQIIVRGAPETYATVQQEADSIRRLLSQVANQTLSGQYVLRIYPSGSLLPMGLDEMDRPLISVNFRAKLVL